MTFEEVKVLLEENNIEFNDEYYDNEEEFLKHIYMFPDLRNANDYKVRSIVIPCKNGVKNIELQFNSDENGEYIFDEMLFGEFCFDMKECEVEFLNDDIIGNINQVINDQIIIITRNNLDKKKWVDDICFNMYNDDPKYGEPGFYAALEVIRAPKSFLEEKLSSTMSFDIYSGSTYQRIIR